MFSFLFFGLNCLVIIFKIFEHFLHLFNSFLLKFEGSFFLLLFLSFLHNIVKQTRKKDDKKISWILFNNWCCRMICNLSNFTFSSHDYQHLTYLFWDYGDILFMYYSKVKKICFGTFDPINHLCFFYYICIVLFMGYIHLTRCSTVWSFSFVFMYITEVNFDTGR